MHSEQTLIHFFRTKTFEGFKLKKNVMLSCNQIIVVAALLCIGLVAGDSISLAVNESRELPSGMTVRVESIQDSRCPANVMCIRAGQVKVKVLVAQSRNSQSVSLVLGLSQQSNTAHVTLGATTYKVTLQSVLPYPRFGSNELKRVTLEVTPL